MQRSLNAVFNKLGRLSALYVVKESSSNLSTATGSWDIFASVGVYRNPIIAPPMTAVEKEYADTVAAIEREGSLLSDFELQEKQDKKKRAALEAQGKDLSELDEEIKVSATVLRDAWEKRGKLLMEKHGIGNIERVQKDSLTSLWRKIDRQIVLLVKQRFSRTDNYVSPWTLPQTINKPGESLRDTAERCVNETIKGDAQVRILGNAPFSVYTYRYPKKLQKMSSTGATGAKIFFFTGQICRQDEIELNKDEIVDYKWVIAEEFASVIKDRRYKSALSTLFFE